MFDTTLDEFAQTPFIQNINNIKEFSPTLEFAQIPFIPKINTIKECSPTLACAQKPFIRKDIRRQSLMKKHIRKESSPTHDESAQTPFLRSQQAMSRRQLLAKSWKDCLVAASSGARSANTAQRVHSCEYCTPIGNWLRSLCKIYKLCGDIARLQAAESCVLYQMILSGMEAQGTISGA